MSPTSESDRTQAGSLSRAVIWDLDGVIADTREYHFEAWRAVCEEMKRPLSEKEFAQLFGLRNREIIEVLLGRAPTAEETRSISERKEHLFRQLARGRVEPLPGALAWLNRLRHRGVLQALASSGPRANIQLVLDSLGIVHHFAAIVSGDEVEAGKPSPDLFLAAARAVEVEPSCCLVIEDSEVGIEAARRAGMKCVAVSYSAPPERLSKADLVVRSLDQLPEDFLQKLLGDPAASHS